MKIGIIENPELLKVSDYARLSGYTTQRIYQFIAEGVIIPTYNRGKVRIDLTKNRIIKKPTK